MTIDTAAREGAPTADAPARRAGRAASGVLVGAGGALLGLAPWLLTGMRLPLQNLWASPVDPERMPIALLPFSQYSLDLIAALLVVGGAIAGLAARVLRARGRRVPTVAVVGGALLVHAAATLQATLVTEPGLQERTLSTIYLLGLVALAVLASLVAAVVLALVARAPRAGALVALALAAVLVAPWLGPVIAPLRDADAAGQPLLSAALAALRWISALLVGAAIAWAGVRGVGRALAAVAALALLWLVPAVITGVANAVGSRVLANHLPDMLDYGVQVTALALTDPALVLPPLALAVLVAAAGLLVRALLRRRGAR